MIKNSKLYYEARDAVRNRTYLKTKTRTLRKYLEELNIVQPWESDPLAHGAVQRKQEWIQTIKTELHGRKDSQREHFWLIAKSFLKYIVAPLIVLIIGFFLLRSFRQADQSNSTSRGLQLPKPQQPISIPAPSGSPAQQNKQQPDQKRK